MHPCLSCGACCATWEVQFERSELRRAGPVLKQHAVAVSAAHACMSGTQGDAPRCEALQGTIGDRARCGIYAHRPKICREVTASYERGERDETCDAARKRHGLERLRPSDWR
ncbi:MAG: YkgJ family cysteine cluster protein [Myxococcota bacterium]